MYLPDAQQAARTHKAAASFLTHNYDENWRRSQATFFLASPLLWKTNSRFIHWPAYYTTPHVCVAGEIIEFDYDTRRAVSSRRSYNIIKCLIQDRMHGGVASGQIEGLYPPRPDLTRDFTPRPSECGCNPSMACARRTQRPVNVQRQPSQQHIYSQSAALAACLAIQ